jgi:hypothetical protein
MNFNSLPLSLLLHLWVVGGQWHCTWGEWCHQDRQTKCLQYNTVMTRWMIIPLGNRANLMHSGILLKSGCAIWKMWMWVMETNSTKRNNIPIFLLKYLIFELCPYCIPFAFAKRKWGHRFALYSKIFAPFCSFSLPICLTAGGAAS